MALKILESGEMVILLDRINDWMNNFIYFSNFLVNLICFRIIIVSNISFNLLLLLRLIISIILYN